MRISINQLRTLCDRINEVTGNALTPYTRENGKFKANIGNYNLSQAYGGVSLHRICTDGGGVDTPLGGYHRPKKELYYQMQSFLSGIENGKEQGILRHVEVVSLIEE